MVLVAVVGEGQDTDSATGIEDTRYLDIAGVHKLNEVLHDDIDAILVEISVITEREEVELETLTLHHALPRDVADVDMAEIRLSGLGAEGSEFRTVERDQILVLWVLVGERLQHLRVVIIAVLRALVT